MNPALRRARREDADFLAWVQLTASRCHLKRGIWDQIIGADDATCLEYLRRLALAEPRSLCHYDSFFVADVDGLPAAGLCGFEPGAGGWAIVAEAQAGVRRDLGWTTADLTASSERMASIWSCFFDDIGADWGIENVATRPGFRRQGLTNALMDRILRAGRARGCKLAQITTFIGNEPAIAAYRKSGFRFSDEKRSETIESALGAPGFVRLIREL